jgi:hypothetical protein
VSQIRSYRKVFDLERRIYRVESMRLNPGGVPVRGVVYYLALLGLGLLLGALPPFALVARDAPWFLRDLVLPGVLAGLLAVIRIDGRPFHLAARAILRLHVGQRRLVGLRPLPRGGAAAIGGGWSPRPIVMLPDGSDSTIRRLRFTGPGALLIKVAHERRPLGRARIAHRHRPHVLVREVRDSARPESGEVILLERAIRLSAS